MEKSTLMTSFEWWCPDETALILRALNIKITKLCHYVLIMIYKINSNKSAIEKVLVAKKLDKVDQAKRYLE